MTPKPPIAKRSASKQRANPSLKSRKRGDAHLLNFGSFASPERNLIFDVNDFDETLPEPWEWDLKRLAASFAFSPPRHCSARVCEREWEEALSGGDVESLTRLSRIPAI